MTQTFGRYVLYPAIARGGMATVHPARLLGDGGFSRLVAAKRLHPQLVDDPELVAMFQDEARIASRIHHPNVVPVLDVVSDGPELVIVQEYVHGVPLNRLMRAAQASGSPIPIDVAVAILADILSGLHAAHESRDDRGELLDVVHRDVSPHNVVVSVDGAARLLDFGIAKARQCLHETREGVFKGKLAYMSPEQVNMDEVTRQADVYAAGVLAWELLANRRFFRGGDEIAFLASILDRTTPTLGQVLLEGPPWILEERGVAIAELEPIVRRALSPIAAERYPSALAMREAVLAAHGAASATDVAEWVRIAGADVLAERQKAVAAASEDDARSVSRIAALERSGALAAASAEPVTILRTPPSMPTPFSSAPPAPISSRRATRALVRHRTLSTRGSRALMVVIGVLLVTVGALASLLYAH